VSGAGTGAGVNHESLGEGKEPFEVNFESKSTESGSHILAWIIIVTIVSFLIVLLLAR